MDGHLKFLLEVWGLNQMPRFNSYSKYEDKLEFPEGWDREKSPNQNNSVREG